MIFDYIRGDKRIKAVWWCFAPKTAITHLSGFALLSNKVLNIKDNCNVTTSLLKTPSTTDILLNYPCGTLVSYSRPIELRRTSVYLHSFCRSFHEHLVAGRHGFEVFVQRVVLLSERCVFVPLRCCLTSLRDAFTACWLLAPRGATTLLQPSRLATDSSFQMHAHPVHPVKIRLRELRERSNWNLIDTEFIKENGFLELGRSLQTTEHLKWCLNVCLRHRFCNVFVC